MSRRPAIRMGFVAGFLAMLRSMAAAAFLFFALAAAAIAAPVLSITPITWNVIGLDSNKVNDGPDLFPVGVRVCNTGDTPATNVAVTYVPTSPTSSYITLQGPGSLSLESLPNGPAPAPSYTINSLPANCSDFYFNVLVTRDKGAYTSSQGYRIDASAGNAGTVSTPANRELYIESLVSQNRNSIISFSGPTTVYVGGTYTYTLQGATATNGYEQLTNFATFPSSVFRILSTSTTYSVPTGAVNSTMYADACGWNNDTTTGKTYRSCVGPANYSGAKAGGSTILTTFVVKVAATGSATVDNVIVDYSGSSYHYGMGGSTKAISITANPAIPISGRVFEDVNYGGGAGHAFDASRGMAGVAGARVELYDSGGNFLGATTTDASGNYTLSSPYPGTAHTVRVVNSTVKSSRSGSIDGLLPVQTFRTTGPGAPDTARVGGENPALADAGANTTNATLASLTAGSATPQSISTFTLTTSGATGIDFGFNFDTIVNTNDAGQGSLRQFILNSNVLGGEASLAQAGSRIDPVSGASATLPSGKESSIFMIPNGSLSSGVAVIRPASVLPAVSGPSTIIDGGTQTANVGNTNAATLGTGGTVGADSRALSKVQGPEVQIAGTSAIGIGLDLQAGNPTVRGIAIYGFGNAVNSDSNANIRVGNGATGALIQGNIIGAGATGFTDPGAGARTNADNIRSVGASGGTLSNNLVGFAAGKGFGLQSGSNGWQITGNEFNGNGIGNPALGGIDIAGSGTAAVSGNLITGNEGAGIDTVSSSGSNTVQYNTITNNGIGASGVTAGVRLYGASSNVSYNIISANYGAGVLVTSGSATNTISRNSIFANGTITGKAGAAASNQIGIDLLAAGNNENTGTSPFFTLNDAADSDSGGNGLLNQPVISNAYIQGSNLVLTGFARPGSIIELFTANPDASGYGEGQTYLATLTEGSAQDTDAATGSYGPAAINGIAQGTDNANRFSFTIPLPGGIAQGTRLTATATLGGATSEFSANAAVTMAPPSIVKAFSPSSMGLNDVATLTFTLTNPNSSAVTGASFSDSYPAGLINTGTPSGATTCANGTVTAAANGNSVALSGATIPANGSCTVTVIVTSAAAGNYVNTIPIGGLTTGNAGSNIAAASATLAVLVKPAISNSFSPATIFAGSTSTLTLTITNISATALTGVAFTDAFPSGLTVAAAPALVNGCGGTISGGAAGNNFLNLTGGNLAGNGACTITVKVTASASGSYSNSASGVSSDQNSVAGAASEAATLTATVPAAIVKSFSPATILVNGTSTMSLTITNPNSIALTGMAFTDVFPNGMQVASSPSAANSCGGTLNGAAPGSTTLSLTGGGLAAGASCAISIAVAGTGAGNLGNTVNGVKASETDTGTAASAVLTVLGPDLRLTKTHGGNLTVGSQATYTLVVDNALGTAATSGTITVVDTLPSGLTYVPAVSGGAGWNCSAAGQTVTCTSNSVITAGASANPLSIAVSVGQTAVPNVTNSASVSGGGEPPGSAGNNNAYDPALVVLPAQNAFLTDGAQAALPGTVVFYPHTFNASLAGTVAFSVTDTATPQTAGWSNLIYLDSNCNAVLDGIEGNAVLTSGVAVNPGAQVQEVCIIVKTFVPATAPYSARDVITVTAAFTSVSGANSYYTRTDITTVGAPTGAGLTLQKSVRNITAGGTAGTSNAAKPGDTLEYTITYLNNSDMGLSSIAINDATPAFTHFVSAACGMPLPAGLTSCSVTAQPNAGATGSIAWTLGGTLGSAATGTVVFQVAVD